MVVKYRKETSPPPDRRYGEEKYEEGAVITPWELELTVLSALLNPEAMRKAEAEGICDLSFDGADHAKVWGYLQERAREGVIVTAADVKSATTVELLDGITDTTTFVKELSKKTLTKKIDRTIRDTIYGDRMFLDLGTAPIVTSPAETLRELVGALNDLNRQKRKKSVLFYDGDGAERMRVYREAKASREAGVGVGSKTGLACFDDEGNFWQPGELCVITGPLNSGKSTLLFWLAAYAYHFSNKKVLVISPENSREDVKAKFDASIAGWREQEFSVRAVQKHEVAEDEYERFVMGLEERRDLNIVDASDTGEFHLSDIQSLVHEYSPDFLIIDGIHLIKGRGSGWEVMKATADALKGLSLGMEMTTIVSTQPKREVLMTPGTPAVIGQTGYGISLEEACDRLISMAEVKGQEGQRVFKVPKMRSAAKIEKKQYLSFDVDRGHIEQWHASGIDDFVDFN